MAVAGISHSSPIPILNIRIAPALAGLAKKNHLDNPVKRGAEGGDLNYFAAKKPKNYRSEKPNLEELEKTIRLMEDWIGEREVGFLKEHMEEYRRYQPDPSKQIAFTFALSRMKSTLLRIKDELTDDDVFPRDIFSAYLGEMGYNVQAGTRRLEPYLDELSEEIQTLKLRALHELKAARAAPRPSASAAAPAEGSKDDDDDVRMK